MARATLALVIVLLVAACSGDSESPTTAEGAAGGTDEAPEEVDGTSTTAVTTDPAACEELADEELELTRELLALLASEDGTIEPDALDGLADDDRARIEELEARSDEVSARAGEVGCLDQLDALICERVADLPVDEVIVEQKSSACTVLDDQLAVEDRMAAIDTCVGLADEGGAALEELLAGVAGLPVAERPESIEGEVPSAITDAYVLVYSAIDVRAAELGCTNDVLQPLLCERIDTVEAEGPFAEELLAEIMGAC
jgi:hypothetical protein